MRTRTGPSSVCDGRPDELDQRIDVPDRLPGSELNRNPVGDTSDEACDLLRRRVPSQSAALLLCVNVLETGRSE